MLAEPVKCVVWDLDGTLWDAVAVELPPGQRPRLLPAAQAALATLAQRGIIHSVASRTDPAVGAYLDGDPDLSRWFVARQLGWGHKSDAIARIAAELGIDPAAIVFVDDDPFERAEVAAMLPAVRVLAPAELYARLDAPELAPAVVTGDARQRLRRYRTEQHRRAAERASGDRAAFLRSCRLRLSVRPAGPADLDRLAELVERTHRFNSTGARWTRDRLAELVAQPGQWLVPVARLSDRFGDYGLIGAALVELVPPDRPRLHLFTISCRAAGRGTPAALLRWLLVRLRDQGADTLLMDVAPQQANLELRMLLRRSGFQAAGSGLLGRSLTGDLPDGAPWVALVEEPAGG